MSITWKGDEFLALCDETLARNMTKAGVYFTSKLRGYLNTSQPYKRTGTTLKGLNPSSPGEYPKKLSGQLQRSMTWELDKQKKTLTVGTNLKG